MQTIDYLPDDPNDPGNGGGTTTPVGESSYGTLVMAKDFVVRKAGDVVDILVYLNCYSADDLRFSAYLFIDGEMVQVASYNFIFDQSNSKAQGTLTIPAIVEGVSVGTHQLRCRIKNRENEAALQVLPGSQMRIGILKQGAI